MMLLTTFAFRAAAQPATRTNSPSEQPPLESGTPPATHSPPADLPLIPGDIQLLKESLLWQQTGSLRAGAGYDDNVLLSPRAAYGSALATAGLDYSLSRLPLDGWGVDLKLGGDDVRYLQKTPSDGTDFWVADCTVKRFVGDHWQVGVEGLVNYLDEVDYVGTLDGPEAVEVQGEVLRITPFLRRNLSSNWWTQLEAPAGREMFEAPLDNTWKYGPLLRLGYSDDQQEELTLGYQFQEILHDDWPALDSEGREISGRKLALTEHRVDLDWRRYWDAANRWSTDTKFFYARAADNGGSFFNFDEFSASERVRCSGRNWELAATIRGSYLDYPVQRTRLVFGPTLNQMLLHATVHGERRLTKWLRLYAEYNYERVLSNLGDIRYAANTVTAGLIWEF